MHPKWHTALKKKLVDYRRVVIKQGWYYEVGCGLAVFVRFIVGKVRFLKIDRG